MHISVSPVEFVVEFFQLRDFFHVLPLHHMRWLHRIVAFLVKKLETKIDQGEIEKDAKAFQEVAARTGNVPCFLELVAIQLGQDLVVR